MVYKRQEASITDAQIWAERHYNFMTPRSVSFSAVFGKPNIWVELTRGSGFQHDEINGITVIIWNVEKQQFQSTGHKYSGLNKSFSNRKEASKYFHAVIDLLEGLKNMEIEA